MGFKDDATQGRAHCPALDNSKLAGSAGRNAAAGPDRNLASDRSAGPHSAGDASSVLYRRLRRELAARRAATAGNGRVATANLPGKSESTEEPASKATAKDKSVALLAELMVTPSAPPWRKIALIATCLVAVAVAWSLYRSEIANPAAVAALPPMQAGDDLAQVKQALQQERDRAEQLNRELTTAWRVLTSQAAASADTAVMKQELTELRQALQFREGQAASFEDLLAQERSRNRLLEEQLAATRRNPTSGRPSNAPAAAKAAAVPPPASDKLTDTAVNKPVIVPVDGLTTTAAKPASPAGDEVARAAATKPAPVSASDNAAKTPVDKPVMLPADELETAADKAVVPAGDQLAPAAIAKAATAQRPAGDKATNAAVDRPVMPPADAPTRAADKPVAPPGDERAQPATDKPAIAQRPASDKVAKTSVDKPVMPAGDKPAQTAAADKNPAAPPPAPDKPATLAQASGGLELARLMLRASQLVGEGNIGAARTVLERAVETGNAAALFALAETYDPIVLSSWGTFGTQGDVAKARELYARAFAGGAQEARDRLDALRQ